MRKDKPVIGVTMGDAAGIGPEITAKVFAEPRLRAETRPLVIGDAGVMTNAVADLGLDLKVRSIDSVADAEFAPGQIDVLNLPVLSDYEVPLGKADPRCGEASVAYVKKACQLALDGEIAATTSAPVNKEAVHLAGYSYGGQTEMVAEACGVTNYAMMLISGNLRLLFVTNHIPLSAVSEKVTKERVYNVVKLAYDALSSPGVQPVIAVAGLNPHAGDGGLLGREDIERIVPAIEQAHAEGMASVVGPLPPDTIFIGARDGKYDAVISMYHDHGSTAMKLLGFQQIVTLLVGMPIIRTSVGHGTAYDIAGQGIADHGNLLEAVLVAADVAKRKGGSSC